MKVKVKKRRKKPEQIMNRSESQKGGGTNLAVWSSVGCFKAPLTGSITTPKPEMSAEDPS